MTERLSVKFTICAAMAEGLRTMSPLATWNGLAPDFGISTALSGCEVEIRGEDPEAVHRLADLYRRVDEAVRAHGVEAFSPERLMEIAPDLSEPKQAVVTPRRFVFGQMDGDEHVRLRIDGTPQKQTTKRAKEIQEAREWRRLIDPSTKTPRPKGL